ncbi:MAG: hypothetical protein ACXVRU_11125 [Gaiellaceae bacterium]
MTVRINRKAFNHARRLIESGQVVIDGRDDWSEHQPTTIEENRFIEQHGFAEYGKWHLGIDDTKDPETKGRYRFPYGDFERVHRCAVLAAESRAGQYSHHDIELALAHLHGMIEMAGAPTGRRRS